MLTIHLVHFKQQRGYIPALLEFPALSVSRMPFELRHGYGISSLELSKSYYLISPITKDDYNNLSQATSYELFINSIVNRLDFKNLVEYVCNNQVYEGKYSEADIIEQYRKLMKEYYIIVKEDQAKKQKQAIQPNNTQQDK